MWKNIIFSSGNCKKGLQVCIGKWKRPFEQVAWGEENLAITWGWHLFLSVLTMERPYLGIGILFPGGFLALAWG
jgi:hypothetical protein